MIAIRYIGRSTFTTISGVKFYRKRWFAEQMIDGTYLRPIHFLFKHRLELMREDIILTGTEPTISVKYVGKGDPAEVISINGVRFPRNTWVTVPIDFNSRDAHGNDLFNVLGFKCKMEGGVKDNLQNVEDGDRILIYRKYGGLGDILMTSMIFPSLRERFPSSDITYAIPKEFHPLFEGCTDIDHIADSGKMVESLHRLLATKEYGFVADISTSCMEGENRSIREKGYVDRERPDIWAESMGLRLDKHKTCLQFPEVEKTDIIGIAPRSNNQNRNYPDDLTQKLIDSLVSHGHKVKVIHSAPLKFKGAETVSGLSLKELGSVIGSLKLLIASDSGPLHYAGIMGVPAIGLFGPTDYKARLSYYYASGVQGKCLKGDSPCWHYQSATCKDKDGIAPCMSIEPSEIVDMLDTMLMPVHDLNNNEFLTEFLKPLSEAQK